MARQGEFIFADGPAPQLHLPNPLEGFVSDVAALWRLPIGQNIRVALVGHHFAELEGKLELERAPDLPLDARHPLSLRIGSIELSSRQIANWALR